MAFAYVLDKKIFLLNPIPKISYSDEIYAMKPIILNGDLTKIK
jgi:predicted RNA-binding protein with PUA domain